MQQSPTFVASGTGFLDKVEVGKGVDGLGMIQVRYI